MRRTLTAGSLALLTLLAAACGTSSKSSSASSSGGASKSYAACTHWNNIRGDISKGILTDSELRSKVSEVRSSASDSTVEAAATELLSGITSGSKTKIATGAQRLNSACS